MSSVSSLFSPLQQPPGLAGPRSAQEATELGAPAKDSFAALLAQSTDNAPQADSAVPAPASETPGSPGGKPGTVSADLNTLGQALSLGNIAAAQQAFQSLQADLQDTLKASPLAPAHPAAPSLASAPLPPSVHTPAPGAAQASGPHLPAVSSASSFGRGLGA